MLKCLNTGMIGIDVPVLERIGMARECGFRAVDLPFPSGLEPQAVRAALREAGLQPGCAGGLLPGKLSVPEAEWTAALQALPDRLAEAAGAGFSRTTSVLLPFHETLSFDDCFHLHRRRLAEAAPLLREHKVRLGIEYVSPRTRRTGYPTEFLHDLTGVLTLLEAVGSSSVGILLDSFHWHCAGETAGDLASLANENVVVVHVNDALPGRSLDEQVAFERDLPLATGVIDLPGFLNVLRGMHYDGPVTAEPMKEDLNALPPADKLAAVSRAMDAALAPATG